MIKKLVLVTISIIILLGTLTLAVNAKPVEASGTIYIRADGSVDPPTPLITTLDNITYTFTGDITDSIVVERDNITIDGNGHLLQGAGSGHGITLSAREHVTIKNATVKSFEIGISLLGSVSNTVSGNNVTNNDWGVWLSGSSDNSVSGNNITNNANGILLLSVSNNNTINGNNVANNGDGIWLYNSLNNNIYHNNFLDNTNQVYSFVSTNVWDDGYPYGGNYWSSYAGVDSNQDGVGDSSYAIDSDNVDRYPLMGSFYCYEDGLVTIISNSTVSNFGIWLAFPSLFKYVVFKVSGESGFGFCRICIPHTLMGELYNVTIDDAVPYYVNYSVHDNGTHRWIYFSYVHAEYSWVMITPEFLPILILPLLMIATPVVTIIRRRKIPKNV